MNQAIAENVILNTSFEKDPTSEGWITHDGSGATWAVTEGYSGTNSIRVQHPGTVDYSLTDSWSSPLLDTTPLQ